jgi:hypothetical protein
MVHRWHMQVLHAQTFWHPPFWKDWSYGVKNYGVEGFSNGTITQLNFIKSNNWFKICKVADSHTDKQNGNLRSLTIFFSEIRLKRYGTADNYRILCTVLLFVPTMSMVFSCTRVHFSTCNISWIVSKNKIWIYHSTALRVRIFGFSQKASDCKLVIDNNSVLHTNTYNVYYYKTNYMFQPLKVHHQVPKVTS